MTTAEKFYADLLGVDRDWWDRETARTAVEQTRETVARYKAPHAYR